MTNYFLIRKADSYFTYACVSMFEYECGHACRGPLELELQVGISLPVWML